MKTLKSSDVTSCWDRFEGFAPPALLFDYFNYLSKEGISIQLLFIRIYVYILASGTVKQNQAAT